jgi:hypothetical protein
MPSVNINALENDLLLRGVWEGLGTPECHVTGGYVRDRLLSKKSVDLDLVLPGSLEEATGPARRLAARLDTRAHLLGRDANQVWRIETPDIRIELWSRGELSLDQDINRRDFSLNTLVWKLPDGPLEDRAGGVPDLKSGIIRALSIQNLADDPVRLVRAPRFLAQLEGFRIDRETDRWIRDLAPGLFNAPRERVGLELLKLTGAQGAAVGIRSLITLGLFESSAPDDARCDPVWTERNLTALDRLTGSVPHPVTAAVRESGFTASLALPSRRTPGRALPGNTLLGPRASSIMPSRPSSPLRPTGGGSFTRPRAFSRPRSRLPRRSSRINRGHGGGECGGIAVRN